MNGSTWSSTSYLARLRHAVAYDKGMSVFIALIHALGEVFIHLRSKRRQQHPTAPSRTSASTSSFRAAYPSLSHPHTSVMVEMVMNGAASGPMLHGEVAYSHLVKRGQAGTFILLMDTRHAPDLRLR